MAKIFRVSGYFVDLNDMYSKESLESAFASSAYVFIRQLHIEESNDFEWGNDLPITYKNCDMAHLEAYFSSNLPEDISREVKAGQKYRHFKEGKIVEVIAISRNTERINDVTVVYRCEDGRVWNRPYDMFVSRVDAKKYPEHAGEYRFTLVKDNVE